MDYPVNNHYTKITAKSPADLRARAALPRCRAWSFITASRTCAHGEDGEDEDRFAGGEDLDGSA